MLSRLPSSMWAKSCSDVGFINCEPVKFEVAIDYPIWVKQYPHKPEAEWGIRDTIEGLIHAGVSEPSVSEWNTPILPVEKKGTGKYRMAHDLRAVNEVLLTPTIPVPNPYVALTSLLPDQSWFTCIDLANAFFCVPLDESCRDMTSFTCKGQQLRYTRLPQGFALSPGIFNQVLRNALEDCKLPPDVTLIQYVDDLLLAGNYAESCLQATENVLMHLWRKGLMI
ncbi:hypothetical protein P4O66_020932 [Electrophorus voltai]|uniref:ribonuclease H n=1 Tax=Electrophorus voltai TaxID=2609070 RepID=A0AAD8ZQC5_9TELE|nr:hypothetical protein P4O66_020932 [Electrophorus voltai]